MTMEKSIKPVSISKKDILWSYLSQFLSIGAGILILPAILHKLSSQEIGINYILLSISAFIPLLDAGFSPQFTRNITYVFNGANILKKKGMTIYIREEALITGSYRPLSARHNMRINGLLGVGFLLLSVGTFYMYIVTDRFSTVNNMMWIWILFACLFLYDLSLILSFVTDWQRIYQRVSEIVCAQ